MGIGGGIFLIALGAVLAFATPGRPVVGRASRCVGVVLMLAGAAVLLVTLWYWQDRRRRDEPVVRRGEPALAPTQGRAASRRVAAGRSAAAGPPIGLSGLTAGGVRRLSAAPCRARRLGPRAPSKRCTASPLVRRPSESGPRAGVEQHGQLRHASGCGRPQHGRHRRPAAARTSVEQVARAAVVERRLVAAPRARTSPSARATPCQVWRVRFDGEQSTSVGQELAAGRARRRPRRRRRGRGR